MAAPAATAPAAATRQEATIAVVKAPLGAGDEVFHAVVAAASDTLDATLQQSGAGAQVQYIDLAGVQVAPRPGAGGAAAPLDLLRLGWAERVARGADLLLLVTDVDLEGGRAYTLAAPSALARVGVVSARRLSPVFCGLARELDWAQGQLARETAAKRLVALLLHTLGHLLGLPHSPEPSNVLFDARQVTDLDRMVELRAEQLAALRAALARLSAPPPMAPATRRANAAAVLFRQPLPLAAALAASVGLMLLAGLATSAARAAGAAARAPGSNLLGLAATVALAVVLLAVAAAALVRALGPAVPRARSGTPGPPEAVARVAVRLCAAQIALVLFIAAGISAGLVSLAVGGGLVQVLLTASAGALAGALAATSAGVETFRRRLLFDELS